MAGDEILFTHVQFSISLTLFWIHDKSWLYPIRSGDKENLNTTDISHECWLFVYQSIYKMFSTTIFGGFRGSFFLYSSFVFFLTITKTYDGFFAKNGKSVGGTIIFSFVTKYLLYWFDTNANIVICDLWGKKKRDLQLLWFSKNIYT